MPTATWTERFYAAFPLAPAWVGLGVAGVLIVGFLGSEFALGRHELLGRGDLGTPVLGDARITIIHCLLAAYFPTAYLYVIRGSRRTLLRLGAGLDYSSSRLEELSWAVGRYRPWNLLLAGVVGVAVSTAATFQTTPHNPFAWSELNLEVWWHRILGPVIGWWFGCFVYAVLAESNRLSRLAGGLGTIDLLDLRPLMPFTRQALANALLVVGAVSIASLFLLERRFGLLIACLWLGTAVLAASSLVLPLRGVHRRIRADKRSELDRVQAAIRGDRSGLGQSGLASHAEALSLSDLLAYETRISGVREWPFDASTLARLSLYLMIPLGSWVGSAFVERLVDVLLD